MILREPDPPPGMTCPKRAEVTRLHDGTWCLDRWELGTLVGRTGTVEDKVYGQLRGFQTELDAIGHAELWLGLLEVGAS